MAVTWIANSAPTRGNGGGTPASLSVTKPAGVTDGDLILIFYTHNDILNDPGAGWEPTGFTIAPGSPWILCGPDTGGAGAHVAWKIASSEPATWDFNAGSAWAQCSVAVILRGTHATTPVGNVGYLCSTVTGGDVLEFAGVTVAAAGSYVVCFGGSGRDEVGSQFITPATPDELTNHFNSPSPADGLGTALAGGSGAFGAGVQGGWTYSLGTPSVPDQKVLLSLEIAPAAAAPLKVLYLGNSLLGTPDGGGGVNCLLGWMVGEIASSLGVSAYEYKYEVANGYTLKNHRQLAAGGPDDVETELAAGWPDVFVMQEHIPIRNKVIFASGVTEAGLFHDQMTAGVPSGGRSIYLGVSCGAYDDGTSGVTAENFDPPDRDTLRERLVDDHEGLSAWAAGYTWPDVVTEVNDAPARASQPYPLELWNIGYKYQVPLIDAEPLTGFAAVDDMFRDGTHPGTELYYFHALALVAELFDVDVRGAAYAFDAPEGGPQAGLPGATLAAELQNAVYTAWLGAPAAEPRRVMVSS